jgi:hypothetical protein
VERFDTMNEVVIFCESYPQIRNALYLAKKNYQSHPVTIVTAGINDLYKFFKLVNSKVFQDKLNLIYFDIYRTRMSGPGSRIVKMLCLLPDIIKEKRHLKGLYDRFFSNTKSAEVFFFGRHFNLSSYYMLKRLSKGNGLVYMPDPTYDTVPVAESSPASLPEFVHLAWGKSVYGNDVIMGKHPLGDKILGMPDSFFSTNVGRILSPAERDDLLKDFDSGAFKVLDVSNYSLMYFHENLVTDNYVTDSEAFKKVLAEVFEVIGRHFPKNSVALKYHPGNSESETVLPFGDRLPDFIPAEFLYDDKIEVYLGTVSMALTNVKTGTAVSLLDIVKLKDDKTRELLKEIVVKISRSRILFPRSVEEFERILIDIKQQPETLKTKG